MHRDRPCFHCREASEGRSHVRLRQSESARGGLEGFGSHTEHLRRRFQRSRRPHRARRQWRAERSQNQARTTHHGVFQLQFPSARDMAAFCYQRIDDLNDWETEFVTNMVSWVRTRPLSLKQQAHLEKIYLKLGGEVQ